MNDAGAAKTEGRRGAMVRPTRCWWPRGGCGGRADARTSGGEAEARRARPRVRAVAER